MQRTPHSRTLTGQAFFITTDTRNRKPFFGSDSAAQCVLNTLQFFRSQGEIELYGYVIMPDHVHVALRVVEPLRLPDLMRRFKSFVARSLSRGAIWEKGYWSQVIPCQDVLRQKLDYIHRNPVDQDLIARPEDYRWSSARELLGNETWKTVDPFCGSPV